jgi:phosphate-selective porin
MKDPWFRTSALKAGIFNRPFGYEISYSSSRRESPERSTVFRLMFPGERDLGGMLTLQAAKTSPLNFLKLEAGLFSGNGVNRETDSKPDFIGHLSVSNNIGNQAKYGLGLSYYNGSVYQGNENIYKMEGNSFVLDNDLSNTGQYAKREYIGFDGQFNITTEVLGETKLHAEYLSGTQPSGKLLTESPNTSQLSFFTRDTYIRNFKGGYVMFVQDIGKLPFSAVLKYDWYDPNTKVSENEAGRNGTGIADLAQNTLGLGVLWKINNNLRLQAYYEINKYEKTDNIKVGETPVNNLKPNVFTLRLQYKF